jgi:5-formyltetrahydrofolate cyclo-ligase
MFYKPEIRKPLRARRKQLTPVTIQQHSLQIAARLINLNKLLDAKNIGYYLPTEGEADPLPIVRTAILQHKEFYLPAIASESEKLLAFYPHHTNEPLQTNRYGILEPKTTGKRPFDIQHLDVVFVPIVAFDKHCNRLGRGAGYYDRTFAFINEPPIRSKRPYLIGLAYEFQKVSEIVPSRWDIPTDMVVTENDIYSRV